MFDLLSRTLSNTIIKKGMMFKMANKKALSASEIVETHKPKNFKYKYIFKDDEFLDELVKSGYDMDSLDTIQNDSLVQTALNASFEEFERDIVKKANEPTVFDNWVVVSKKMITKADKKLNNVGIGYFDKDGIHYVAFCFRYDKFDILEIFILA